MRKMNKEQKKNIEALIYKIMTSAVSADYARYILEKEDSWTEVTVMQEVIEDVMETSAWEEEGYYNEDDVRFAIGRTLMARMEIEV